jgi:hypothetical protein
VLRYHHYVFTTPIGELGATLKNPSSSWPEELKAVSRFRLQELYKLVMRLPRFVSDTRSMREVVLETESSKEVTANRPQTKPGESIHDFWDRWDRAVQETNDVRAANDIVESLHLVCWNYESAEAKGGGFTKLLNDDGTHLVCRNNADGPPVIETMPIPSFDIFVGPTASTPPTRFPAKVARYGKAPRQQKH